MGLPQDKNSNQTCEIPAVWRRLANKGEDKSRTVSRLSHRLKLLNSEELDQQIHRMALENVKDGINFKTLFAQVLKL